MKRIQGFIYRVMPTVSQRATLEQTAGTCRFIWNSALALQKYRLDKRLGILSYEEMCRELTIARHEPGLEFLAEVHSKPQQQVLKDLNRAFLSFFRGKSGFPRFKKKSRAQDSFRHPVYQGNVELRGDRIKLPALGWLRFRNSRTVLGAIKNVTLRQRLGHWYVAVQTEREVEAPVHPSRSAVGVDLGVAKFAALSNGVVIAPEHQFRRMEARLSQAARGLCRKKKFSKNWQKQKRRISTMHRNISNARQDFLHKNSTAISKNHAMVVMEDLHVGGMSASARGTVANPGRRVRQKSGLNKSILDQGWYEFRRQMGYKLEWLGGHLEVVSARNTSRRCSGCGYVDPGNRRSQSEFCCLACGLRDDADINAAQNILAAGHAATACRDKPLGFSVKQEP